MEDYQELIPKVLKNVNLRQYTNTKTGGHTNFMFFPRNIEELIILVSNLKSDNQKFEILGEMTNVAISEENLDFVVVNMSEFNISRPVWSENRFLTVSASTKMKDLSNWAYKNGIKGLEWMEGIPGTVGAGIFMNAGFLVGQDISTYLLDVKYLDLSDMHVKKMSNQELKFRYRYSKFHDMDVIILEGTFLLTPIKNDWLYGLRHLNLKRKMTKYHKRRANNQPLDLPSAGTVFVPPMPWHIGGMIRELKITGYTIGGAQISIKSPGFIVNVGEMTGEDYFSLVKFIQNQIYTDYKIWVIPEVRLLTNDGDHGNNMY